MIVEFRYFWNMTVSQIKQWFTMKRISILAGLVLVASLFTFSSLGNTFSKDPGDKYEKVLQLVGRMLSEIHYSPQDINDDFSKKVFKKYIDEIDPEKTFFTKEDLDSLKVYENTIDDEINGEPVVFFKQASRFFNKEVVKTSAYYKKILSAPFDFSANEDVQLDGDKIDYVSNEQLLFDRWRKKLKYMTLERYVDLQELQEKNKGKEGYVLKSDSALEKEARDKVQRIMDLTFDRYAHKFELDDQFSIFVNAITTTMDPHTEFFPPVDKRYFDEEMSGRFFGIGATLQYDDGNIKVTSVVTGSPAYKSGQIQVGDIIQKVGQGKEEPVDLTGYSVTDAVKLIRGKQGTEVKLTIRKTDGTIKDVSLVRDQIVQDEAYARSAIVQEDGKKIGYIFLPDFYADFEHPEANRSFTDVAKEIQKLKEQKVDGIVFDLRNNGGGSLYDVVQMAGLFIKDGPVVQVRDRVSRPSVLTDQDKAVQYTGPLVVLVNEFSASASEIFAAAIQDYSRGVIIGSSSTYGKGTVQRSSGLDSENGFSLSNADLGSVKLTMQKFYRVNGGSTQLKGVSSDIVLPDNLEYLKVREKDNSDALPWDQVAKANYTAWASGYDLQKIKQLSEKRLQGDSSFNLISQKSKWLYEQSEKPYSLNLTKFKEEQAKIRATIKELESLLSLKKQMDVNPLPSEVNRWAQDAAKQQRFNKWISDLKKDIYINQGIKVINDIISQQAIVSVPKVEAAAPAKKGF